MPQREDKKNRECGNFTGENCCRERIRRFISCGNRVANGKIPISHSFFPQTHDKTRKSRLTLRVTDPSWGGKSTFYTNSGWSIATWPLTTFYQCWYPPSTLSNRLGEILKVPLQVSCSFGSRIVAQKLIGMWNFLQVLQTSKTPVASSHTMTIRSERAIAFIMFEECSEKAYPFYLVTHPLLAPESIMHLWASD